MVDLTPDASTEVAPDVTPDEPRVPDPRLVAAVELARTAALAETGGDPVGEHIDAQAEDDGSVTHLFAAELAGYRGWRWAVTVADGGPDTPVTVSEVVLLPGLDALVAPAWVPWQERVRAGDLGVGDLLPTEPDDRRLVPGYVRSDDPAVEEVALEVGLGRRRVLSLDGRLDAAERWQAGERGPAAEMARAAPAACGTCGFFLPLAGSMRAAFGVCGNGLAPADGTVVGVEYGCGAHSDVEPDPLPATPVAELIYDDGVDVETIETVDAAQPDPDTVAADPVAPQRDREIVAADPVAPQPDGETVSADPVAPQPDPETVSADPAIPQPGPETADRE